MRRKLVAVLVVLGALLVMAAQCPFDPDLPDPDPEPTPGTVLFFDDFEVGVDPRLSLTSGNWEAVDGEIHSTTEDASAHVIDGASWVNYEAEVDTRTEEDRPWLIPYRGVAVRANGEQDYVVFYGSTQSMWFWVYRDGVRDDSYHGKVNQPLPDDCNIRVRVVGSHYEAFVNDVLVSQFDYDGPTSGTAGFRLRGNQDNQEAVWFDNFRVTAIE